MSGGGEAGPIIWEVVTSLEIFPNSLTVKIINTVNRVNNTAIILIFHYFDNDLTVHLDRFVVGHVQTERTNISPSGKNGASPFPKHLSCLLQDKGRVQCVPRNYLCLIYKYCNNRFPVENRILRGGQILGHEAASRYRFSTGYQ
jgi:hypothetical protein